MGIVNITSDSFSDGGLYQNLQQVQKLITPWIEKKIHWIDIGGESTRPRSTPISSDTEWQRIHPILEGIEKLELHNTLISIDSYHLSTQLNALNYDKVKLINHVKGLPSIQHLSALKHHPSFNHPHNPCRLLITHFHGDNFHSMQDHPLEKSQVISDLKIFFDKSTKTLKNLCFDLKYCYLDPGIGFGKSFAANFEILNNIDVFSNHYNIAIGLSRKSFLSSVKKDLISKYNKDQLSKFFELQMINQGVKLIRTHKPILLLD